MGLEVVLVCAQNVDYWSTASGTQLPEAQCIDHCLYILQCNAVHWSSQYVPCMHGPCGGASVYIQGRAAL